MAELGLFDQVYNPDVLSCLANLSNDEVFTPPDVANAMLDMLPQELFRNPDTTFLDPACKSGIFLREIAKRLLVGLEPQIPDLQDRIDHIMHKQLFAISITELTSLLSRRSVYCSKYPNSEYSVTHFEDAQGNIRYKRIPHTWRDGKCVFCGASQQQYERPDDLETHAYEMIHVAAPQEIFNMKFDVIISNPPYQLSDGGAQASAKPIYNLFVEQAKKLNPRFLTMIIPARWYSGGKGLEEFRDAMLTDSHISILHDFPFTEDCFPGVNIRGGVCYFLWEKEYDNKGGKTEVITHSGKTSRSMMRPLKYGDLDILVRYGEAISILKKVVSKSKNGFVSEIVSSRKPFGLPTDFIKTSQFHSTSNGMSDPVACYGKGLTIGYVERSAIPSHSEWANRWKVMAPRANNIGTELNDDNQNTFVAGSNVICTESYIVIGADYGLDENKATNLSNYLQTRFARFLHSLAKVSQDATSKTYRFIPIVDYAKAWDDDELYQMFGLEAEEIAFINETIKPM